MSPRRAVLVALAAATVAMAWILANGLVYDAAAIVLRDERLVPPVDWAAMLTGRYWHSGLWRPLTLWSFALQATLPGAVIPAVFHAVSLALYLVVVALVVRLACRTGIDAPVVAATGVLFAVHPTHVEVVASVVGQAELLVAIALLGATLVWQRASLRGVSGWTLPLLLLAQAAAVGAKEQGFVLPVLLAGQALLLPGRIAPRRAAGLLGTVGLLAILLLVTRGVVTGSLGGETPAAYLVGLDAPSRWLTSVGVLPDLARLLLLPLHLQGEYGPPALPIGPPAGLRHLLGALVAATWLLAMARWWRRRPVAALGLWWIAVGWLPWSSLLAPAGVLLAERLLFLPTIGLTLVVADLVAAREAPRPRWLVPATAALAVLFATVTVRRIAVWRSPASFFGALTSDAPEVYRGWYVRGIQEREDGNLVAAEAHFRHALTLWDRDPVVHETLGQLLRHQGRCAEAVPVFRAGLALDPERTQLRARLGECLLAVGDSGAAAATARDGIALGQDEFAALLRRAGAAVAR